MLVLPHAEQFLTVIGFKPHCEPEIIGPGNIRVFAGIYAKCTDELLQVVAAPDELFEQQPAFGIVE